MSLSAEPRLFVDWSVCERLLSTTLTGGVRVCCLLSVDGSVLCVAGELHCAKLLSALLSSVYASYSEAAADEWLQAAAAAEEAVEGGLRTLTAVCDDGLVSVARVGRFLVALQSDASYVGQAALKVSRRPIHRLLLHTAISRKPACTYTSATSL